MRALITGTPESPVAPGAAAGASRRAGVRLPGSGRRSVKVAVTSTLLLLVVLAAGAGVRSVLTEPDATVRGSVVSPASLRTVSLDGYTGRAAEEVWSALVEQGLLARLGYDATGTPVGTVSRVDPGGDVADPGPAPDAADGKGRGGG